MITLMSPDRWEVLRKLLLQVKPLPGEVAELGVYQGGTLKMLADLAPEKTCFGFDTFNGQPAESWREIDFHKPGEFGDTGFERVMRELPQNIVLFAGVFPGSAPNLEVKLCFAHVDFDLEKSTEDAIAWLTPRMVPGGVVVFDDYHSPNCMGVDRAIARAGLQVIESAPNQCYWTAP
jgi:O-methyltransferase